MNDKSTCSLCFRIARPDAPFMMLMVPHLVRACHYPFREIVLVVDTAPLQGGFENRPGIVTPERLFELCEQLMKDRVVTRVKPLVYHTETQREIYKKHFGRNLWETHNFRGSPLLASILPLETVDTEYVAYLDSDMLLYQDSRYNWLEEGMRLLEADEQVMVVTPLSGPPAPDRVFRGQTYPVERREGYWALRSFTNRKFLIHREKFCRSMLPLNVEYLSWKRRLLSRFTRKSAVINWEVMVSRQLQRRGYVRADLDTDKCWALHTPDHGSAFLEALPNLIERVERGEFPETQAGDYDLRLELWK